jgi:hypothetical protein
MASEPNGDVLALMRKAKIVASKLKLGDFRAWIDNELNGYLDVDDSKIPEYRKCRARIVYYNPYHGQCPVIFEDPKEEEALTAVTIRDSLDNLVSLLKNPKDMWPQIALPSDLISNMMRAMERDNRFALPPTRVVARNYVERIVLSANNNVLDWALNLEEQGILGEGVSFSNAEIQTAQTVTNVFNGPTQAFMGDVQQSAVTQNVNCSVAKNDFDGLLAYLKKTGIQIENVSELKDAIMKDGESTTIRESGKFGPKVGAWMGKMVGKAATGAWSVSCTVAANLLTAGLKQFYGMH